MKKPFTPRSQTAVIRRDERQKEWKQERMITHQSGSAWDTLMTNASPVWPERVRPLLSTIVPEISIDKENSVNHIDLRIQSQKQNKIKKLQKKKKNPWKRTVALQPKAILFNHGWKQMNAKCPGEGLESHRNRKGKVREALGFTPPGLLEKTFHSYLRLSWSPAVQHVIRLTTLMGSNLLSASSAGLPSASVNWQSAVSGGGHFMVRFKSIPPWALQTVHLWFWGTNSARLPWNSLPFTSHL